jgi:dephospho-CoA kinase
VSVVIGLTGGIGSGKSTVSRMLGERGAVVIDADAIVHELQAPGLPMLGALAEVFGPGILDAAGALDRKGLAAMAFRDDEARERLNAIVHPQVGIEFAKRLGAALEDDAKLVVLDIPLLLENRRAGRPGASQSEMAAIVVVWVPREVQIERTMSRDACTREEALARIRAQLSLDEKRALADRVIDNSGSLAETERQVEALVRELCEAAA